MARRRSIIGIVLFGALAASAALAKEKPFAGRVVTDLVYVERGRKEMKLDAWAPPGEPQGAPVVLVIHGGGFTGGWRWMMDPLCRALAEKGIVVFNLQYRLAPRYPFPAPIEDTRCALRWIARHAPEYGGDPARLGVTGESAGGYLSAMAVFPPPDQFCNESCPEGAAAMPEIKAAVLYYGPYDLAASLDDDFKPIPLIYYLCLGKTLKQDPERYREFSATTYLHPGLPPLLLQSGTRDYFLPEAQGLYAKLQALGEDAELIVWEGAKHGFAISPKVAPGSVNYEKTAEFFLKHLVANR